MPGTVWDAYLLMQMLSLSLLTTAAKEKKRDELPCVLGGLLSHNAPRMHLHDFSAMLHAHSAPALFTYSPFMQLGVYCRTSGLVSLDSENELLAHHESSVTSGSSNLQRIPTI